MSRFTIRQRLRYRFDNLMARGAPVQIGLLAVITVAITLVTMVLLNATSAVPVDDKGAPAWNHKQEIWHSFMYALDPGTLAGDPATDWTYLFIMLIATLGGLFVLSALIGILNNSLGRTLENLREGKSAVIERGHTVVLGWTPKIHTLLSELATAADNRRDACVVILADRDKITMDDDLAVTLGKRRLKVVTRSGNPLQLVDLARANLEDSKAVVVMSPEYRADGTPMPHGEADTIVLKTLLAIAKLGGPSLHVVAELQDERTVDVARMVMPDASLIVAPPMIGRLLVQTGRQAGLSMVYQELLDFAGAEIYMTEAPPLVGRKFQDVLAGFEDSAVMGVLAADGALLLPPPMDRALAAGDRVIAISEDDDTLVANARRGVAIDEGAIVSTPRTRTPARERTLVLGANDRLALVLRELDSYVAPGSETLVIGEAAGLGELPARGVPVVNMTVKFEAADITDRGVLDGLAVETFDHVLVLSETAGRDQPLADARTMVALLHLRDLARKSGRAVPITSEILEIQNRELAAVAEADDFIVSNTLVSLLVSQVSENRHLVRVFDDLFSAGGYEIYLKPSEEFVQAGGAVDFYTVVESAARRGEVAIGYRVAADARAPEKNFGVIVNPKKSAKVTFAAGDKIVVLADA